MNRSIRLAFALAVLPSMAFAQAYPARPVRIIVPFVAGGAADIVTRVVSQKLGEAWGQQVVVDNRAGAGGNIGGELAAKATPDGYTLFMTTGSIVTANQHIYRKMPFDPAKDLVAITNVASGPQVLVVDHTPDHDQRVSFRLHGPEGLKACLYTYIHIHTYTYIYIYV